MRLVDGFQQVFHYMANQGMTWASAISELVDNSFDAGALRVELNFSSSGRERFWEVIDDGKGCPDITKMLPLGSHFNQGITKQTVGMFGIGLKDAWAFSGDEISIDTVSRGRRGQLQVCVSNVNDLDGPDPAYCDALSTPSGTRVRLSLKRDRRTPNPDTWDRVEWIFTPALASGRQIAINGLSRGKKRLLKAVEVPPFIESVEDEFEVEGKKVSISIGIVKDGHRMMNGPFWIIYGHRVIRHSTIGAGKYSTLRMGGRITLGEGWKLTKNKDDLSDLSDDLADAIHSRIKFILQKHDLLAENVASNALKNELEAMLDDSLQAVKGKRQPPLTPSGTVEPKGTARRHRKFSKTQPGGLGEGGGGRKRRGFSIDWMDDDGPKIGEYDQLTGVVRLNVRNEFIAGAKADGNKPALYGVAVTLIAYTECHCDPQGRVSRLMFETGSFADTFARMMRTVRSKMEAAGNVA